jgi:hypothetical protein
MQHRCGTRCSIPCCKSAGTISSVRADWNAFRVFNAHQILDWLHSLPGFSILCSFCVWMHQDSAVHVHPFSHHSVVIQESKLWIAVSEFPFQFWVHWQLGSLIVLTLLVACFVMIFMSLAPPTTSMMSWQDLLHGDCLASLISLL